MLIFVVDFVVRLTVKYVLDWYCLCRKYEKECLL